jgi:predicted DNA-binding transcriptional regulator YafY
VLLHADADRRGRRVRTGYRAYSGERTLRELSPYGLVVHSARWYLAAYDHLRDDLRTLRIDRMSRTTLLETSARPAPAGYDAVEHVSRSLARVPWGHEVEVMLDLPVDRAARRLPPALAELVETEGGTLLRMRVDSLDWMAGTLASLRCGFTILAPDELRTSVRELAARLVEVA